MTTTIRTPTAEHCQRKCKNHTTCTHFTWVTRIFNDSLFSSYFWNICSFYKREIGDSIIDKPGKISGPAQCFDQGNKEQIQDGKILKAKKAIQIFVNHAYIALEPFGDGFCEDEHNNGNSLYDGGDCCSPSVDCSYCNLCQCHETKESTCSNSTGFLKMPCTSGRSKLMVTLGVFNHNISTEVVVVENPSLHCEHMAHLPYFQDARQINAVGAWISGAPVVCVPRKYYYNYTMMVYINDLKLHCFYYQSETEQWVHFYRSGNYRRTAFGIALNDETLWITGGEYNDAWEVNYKHNSTEIVQLDRQGPGPYLPYSTELHCIIDMNDGSFLLTGGWEIDNVPPFLKDLPRDETWFFNVQADKWTQGPTMSFSKMEHGCGLIYDSVSTETKIAVTLGGIGHWATKRMGDVPGIKETELWSENFNYGKWKLGPDLPKPMTDMFSVATHDKKQLIVGGGRYHSSYICEEGHRHLYRLQCFDLKCEWTRLKQTLYYQRPERPVAFLMADDFEIDCNKT